MRGKLKVSVFSDPDDVHPEDNNVSRSVNDSVSEGNGDL